MSLIANAIKRFIISVVIADIKANGKTRQFFNKPSQHAVASTSRRTLASFYRD